MKWKTFLFLASIGLAFIAVRRSQPATNSAAAQESAAATPQQILAALPAAGDQDGEAARRKAAAAPGHALTWVTLGDTLAQEFRNTADESLYAHAEAVYQQALNLDPRNTGALTGLAWVSGGRHDFTRSIAWAEQALALDSLSAPAHGIIGDAYVELGRYDEALESYQQMMDARPDLSAWSRGAHLLWLMGDADKGRWLMEKAIRAGAPFAENTAWCRARLAMMHFNDGALLPAAQVLEPALQAGSRNVHLLLAAARVEAARGDGAAAEKYCRILLEKGTEHQALVFLGDLYQARGATAEAEEAYQKVEALHAGHQAAEKGPGGHSHSAMARFFADHDRHVVEALRMAKQNKLSPNVMDADLLAWAHFKNGEITAAANAMKRALKLNTPDPMLHYHAGMIAGAAGDRTSAVKHLQLALSMNAAFDPLQAPLAQKALEKLSETTMAAVEK